MSDHAELIRSYALQNAVRYDGKANPGSVLGQILRERPELKSEIAALGKLAATIVAEVNKLGVDAARAELEASHPELLERKEKVQKSIFEGLGWEPGTPLITGMPPEPSKYPHIGHAKAFLVNSEMAKWGNGEFRPRFDDTNPALAKQEFYEITIDNMQWLGIDTSQMVIASDYMPQLLAIADKLVDEGHCFVDDTDADTTNKQRYAGEPSAQRNQPLEETKTRWANLKEGEVLRLKIDPAHKNTTMRDPTVFRVIREPHVRTGTKFHKWPTYDFETCLMDGIQGITFRIRSKEFELRTELHQYIQRIAGMPISKYYEQARFTLEGVETSGRVIREKVNAGELIGWDDPSLVTLVALRRRGFTPEAIKSFVLSLGITKNDATLTWDDLYLHNRRVLNESAKRLFFLDDPVSLDIVGAPSKQVALRFFPHAPAADRAFDTNTQFLVARDDAQALEEGKLYRLMDCLNFEKRGAAFHFVDDSLDTYRARGSRILHYIPADHDGVIVHVLMPDHSSRRGIAESRVADLAVGSHVQFERFGFCRLDRVEGSGSHAIYHFWFTHK